MKMVKSLLLVTAAGLVAASGAQAADLPVKAKPVEYVKVCSLYGAGFYYIPGTDICLKLGGYVRYQINTGMGNDISFGPLRGASGSDDRHHDIQVGQRVRALMTIDTRQQTAYGTLRTYFLFGYTHDTTNSTIGPSVATGSNIYANRGFIQIAGFTLGKATSFYDFVSTAAVAYNAGFVTTSDTGDAGQIVGSYTAQFGNGFSGTIGIEQSRRNPTFWAGTTVLAGGVNPITIAGGPVSNNLDNVGGTAGSASRPDVVGNLRVDQAWGAAQLSGAIHDVSAGYYGAGFGGGTTISGHPDDKWGWAISPGVRINTPMIGPGDYFQAAFVYSEGALRYASFSGCGQGPSCTYWSGDNFGFGFAEEAVYTGTPGTGAAAAVNGIFDLTTAWSVFASYEHFWTPALRTSLYGSYLSAEHTAVANAGLCANILTAAQFAAGMQCNSDYQTWTIGSRSQWNVTKDLYVGVDVIYNKLNSGSINGGNSFTPSAGMLMANHTAGTYRTADQDRVSVTWRVHRDIVP